MPQNKLYKLQQISLLQEFFVIELSFASTSPTRFSCFSFLMHTVTWENLLNSPLVKFSFKAKTQEYYY